MLIWMLLIVCLFNGCFNYLDYAALNCRMFYEWLIGYDLEKSGSGLL
jgi:hypothetical protein